MKLSFITPLDQPTGKRRLLGELKTALQNDGFDHFRLIVAYAKAGPLLRLESILSSWNGAGKKIDAIFGLDQHGTTAQALLFALDNFDSVYVTREPNMTFHPKIYMFSGAKDARVFVGSNNLTVGGTETNFEATLCLDIALPADKTALAPFEDCWAELLPKNCPATAKLSRTLLDKLIQDGVVPDESAVATKTGSTAKTYGPKAPKSGLKTKPPSTLPGKKPVKAKAGAIPSTKLAKTTEEYGTQGLAIQIKPHHNGEIFLSVTAALQNPAFFGWPFTGMTVPKKGGNAGYPQLTPDPRVNISVFGKGGAVVLTREDYALNTVYYEKKSEIRITATPLVNHVPPYSIMVMRKSDVADIDYDIEIHRPDSPDYGAWVATCNQSMPGGGQAPRKFGWF